MEQLASILRHNQRVAPTCCGSLAGADPEGPSGGGGDATQVAYLQEENETFAHLPIFLRCDESPYSEVGPPFENFAVAGS